MYPKHCHRCKTSFTDDDHFNHAYSCCTTARNNILNCGYGSLHDLNDYATNPGYALKEGGLYCDGCITTLIEMKHISLMGDWQGPPERSQWEKEKEEKEYMLKFIDEFMA